jgi:hypothetical protein
MTDHDPPVSNLGRSVVSSALLQNAATPVLWAESPPSSLPVSCRAQIILPSSRGSAFKSGTCPSNVPDMGGNGKVPVTRVSRKPLRPSRNVVMIASSANAAMHNVMTNLRSGLGRCNVLATASLSSQYHGLATLTLVRCCNRGEGCPQPHYAPKSKAGMGRNHPSRSPRARPHSAKPADAATRPKLRAPIRGEVRRQSVRGSETEAAPRIVRSPICQRSANGS